LILYVDTSALVKLYVDEESSDSVRRAVARASHVATSRVAYPEARSAFARRQAEGYLSRTDVRRSVTALDKDFSALVVVELTAGVATLAGELAERHGIRGFDAIHLASALECGRLLGTGPSFLTFDARQTRAAVREGLREHVAG
jgi:predicted nucleic acid-binding protein